MVKFAPDSSMTLVSIQSMTGCQCRTWTECSIWTSILNPGDSTGMSAWNIRICRKCFQNCSFCVYYAIAYFSIPRADVVSVIVWKSIIRTPCGGLGKVFFLLLHSKGWDLLIISLLRLLRLSVLKTRCRYEVICVVPRRAIYKFLVWIHLPRGLLCPNVRNCWMDDAFQVHRLRLRLCKLKGLMEIL